MATILLPRISRGTALVVRLVVVSVPAAVAVAIVLLILFVALFMGERQQRYALRAASSVFKMATAMTSLPRTRQ